MKIPLKAELINKSGRDILEITTGKETVEMSPPFKPYCIRHAPTGNFKCRDLHTGKEICAEKIDFYIEGAALNFWKSNTNAGREGGVYYKPYIEALCMDMPDFFVDYPTEEYDILYMDIEVATDGKGIFPGPDRLPIMMIGTALNDDPIICFSHDESEKSMLAEFIEYIIAIDPDIIVGYNSMGFDIPFIYERCMKYELKDIGLALSRTRRKIISKRSSKFGKNVPFYQTHKRVHFDIFSAVERDQVLVGEIKNMQMKTVGKYFNIPNIKDLPAEKKTNMLSAYMNERDEVTEYLVSDVNLTRELCKIYLPRFISLAEFMKIPLDMAVNGTPSLIPRIFIGRELVKRNIYPFESNMVRYEDTGTRYEAAYVTIDEKKKGFHKKVFKYDFMSMYPSSIRTFNLSPETTKIKEFREYTGEYRFCRKGNVMWLNIPDRNFNKDVVIKINLKDEGFLKKEMVEFFRQRKIIKQKMKDAETKGNKSEAQALHSYQWSIKVLMNSIYGVMGNPHLSVGDMAVGIAIVGLCRYIIRMVTEEYEDCVIEVDTDGIYTNRRLSVDTINEQIRKWIKGTFNVDSYMFVEEEEYNEGYFYKAKNYILRKTNGEIKKSGSGLKGSSKSKLFDDALNKCAIAVLDQNADMRKVVRELFDLKGKNIDDFILRTKLSMDVDAYAMPNAIQVRLANQVIHELKEEITPGTQLEYVKVITPDGYKLTYLVNDMRYIDFAYYAKEIKDVLEIFELDDIMQPKLQLSYRKA
ncbi:hypothetical protein DRJ17_05060 [Candidatus Woesearchaeota archaeon]|nr:MAG: hypothetical protein DRJ17_05060 [Candidatus Woesearchaeota archaeon]